ncbi:MAG TPA: amidohydrolase [Firmicutes bacterium]|nr:amidohydrolase [Bacillota bacterium]
MVIDSHAHVMEPTAKQLSFMEEAGVDKTILFSTSIHPEKVMDLAAFEQEIRRLFDILAGNCKVDERKSSMQRSTVELCDAIKKHPEHFLGFGPVPLGIGEYETADWIEENIIVNGFLGVGEFSPGSGSVYLLENVFKALMELGKLPVWIHTFHPMTSADLMDIADLARKYSTVPVILGHMGGANWLDAIKIAKDQANLYLDFSASVTAIAPQFAMKELPERCLFSSDAPFGYPMLVRKMVERVSEDEEVTKMVLGGNISRLLNID